MKRFLMLLTLALTCLSLFAATAEAKRFGGGGSIGKQQTMAPQQAQKAPAAAPAPAPAAAPAPAPPETNGSGRWPAWLSAQAWARCLPAAAWAARWAAS